MPRIDPDLGAVSATTPIYPRGDYVIEIGKANPFGYVRKEKDEDGNQTGVETDVAGCTLIATMVGRLSPTSGKIDKAASKEIAGEDVTPIRLYTHSKKAYRMTKQTLMAVAGYARDAEKEFNENFWDPNEFWIDFEVDAEGQSDVSAGAGWGLVVGNQVRVTLNQGMWNGEPQQNFSSWAPM